MEALEGVGFTHYAVSNHYFLGAVVQVGYVKNPVSLSKNNLIFFMFIRFPTILLVRTTDSYLHEFCAWGIYIAIFSNMVQHQRARYRVVRYVIVNNVTTATLESKTKNA